MTKQHENDRLSIQLSEGQKTTMINYRQIVAMALLNCLRDHFFVESYMAKGYIDQSNFNPIVDVSGATGVTACAILCWRNSKLSCFTKE